MEYVSKFTAIQNAPYYLTQEELDDPRIVIQKFFDNRHLAEHRQTLWDMQCSAISSDLADLLGAREIGNWVQYFRMLEELIEAIWILHKGNGEIEIKTFRHGE